MRHLRSIYAPEAVYTPNNVAVVGGGGFLVTNDHSPTLNWVRYSLLIVSLGRILLTLC